MVTYILSRTCTSAEMGDIILTQKVFTPPCCGGGKVGQSQGREVYVAASQWEWRRQDRHSWDVIYVAEELSMLSFSVLRAAGDGVDQRQLKNGSCLFSSTSLETRSSGMLFPILLRINMCHLIPLEVLSNLSTYSRYSKPNRKWEASPVHQMCWNCKMTVSDSLCYRNTWQLLWIFRGTNACAPQGHWMERW